MVNCQGCITGGTGKTVTLQTLPKVLSDSSVPIFMADVNGDLFGMAKAGAASVKLKWRLDGLGIAGDLLGCL